MRFALIIFVLSTVCFAQTPQPEKESSADLRSGLVMFSIESKNDDSIVWLERTGNLDYFLKKKKDDEIQKIQKIPTKEAIKLDQQFAAKFLKCQYELPASEEDCKVTLHLVMKGDNQNICKKDEKKTQEINVFLKELETRF